MSRIELLFSFVRRHAARRVPWLRRAKVRFCAEADKAHRRRWRLFAHTEEGRVYTVCFARAAETDLTDEEVIGMSAHELGHIVGLKERYPEHAKPHRGRETPKKVQDEADRIAREVLGFPGLRYNRRTLQEVRK